MHTYVNILTNMSMQKTHFSRPAACGSAWESLRQLACAEHRGPYDDAKKKGVIYYIWKTHYPFMKTIRTE
jgi:hypothetical protein